MAHGPRIAIPLDIPVVRVLRTEQTQAGEYILTVERTITSTPCRRCGRVLTELHGRDEPRRLRHLAVFGAPVYIQIHPKRFRCRHCDGQPTTTQPLDWYDPQALHTKAYERHLIVALVNSTVSAVVAKEDVSSDALVGILDRWIATTVDWARVPPFQVLGIDEIALTKGHRNFVAVITAQTDTGALHVLAILPDRVKATVAGWLSADVSRRLSSIVDIFTIPSAPLRAWYNPIHADRRSCGTAGYGVIRIDQIVCPESIAEKLAAKHQLTAHEARSVLYQARRIRFAETGYVPGEDVYAAFGQSVGGRYIVVFFVYKPSTATAIIISAREMTDKERTSYGRK